MKKIYEKPEVMVATFVKTDVICSSPYGSFEEGFSLSDVEETNATNGNLCKGRGGEFGDIW